MDGLGLGMFLSYQVAPLRKKRPIQIWNNSNQSQFPCMSMHTRNMLLTDTQSGNGRAQTWTAKKQGLAASLMFRAAQAQVF